MKLFRLTLDFEISVINSDFNKIIILMPNRIRKKFLILVHFSK